MARRRPAAADRAHGLLRGAARPRRRVGLRRRPRAAGGAALPGTDLAARPAGDRRPRPGRRARAVRRRRRGRGASSRRAPSAAPHPAAHGRAAGRCRSATSSRSPTPSTSDHMTWDVTDLGFRMGLSPRVPRVLARHVGRGGPRPAARPARTHPGRRGRLGGASRRPAHPRGGGRAARAARPRRWPRATRSSTSSATARRPRCCWCSTGCPTNRARWSRWPSGPAHALRGAARARLTRLSASSSPGDRRPSTSPSASSPASARSACSGSGQTPSSSARGCGGGRVPQQRRACVRGPGGPCRRRSGCGAPAPPARATRRAARRRCRGTGRRRSAGLRAVQTSAPSSISAALTSHGVGVVVRQQRLDRGQRHARRRPARPGATARPPGARWCRSRRAAARARRRRRPGPCRRRPRGGPAGRRARSARLRRAGDDRRRGARAGAAPGGGSPAGPRPGSPRPAAPRRARRRRPAVQPLLRRPAATRADRRLLQHDLADEDPPGARLRRRHGRSRRTRGEPGPQPVQVRTARPADALDPIDGSGDTRLTMPGTAGSAA